MHRQDSRRPIDDCSEWFHPEGHDGSTLTEAIATTFPITALGYTLAFGMLAKAVHQNNVRVKWTGLMWAVRPQAPHRSPRQAFGGTRARALRAAGGKRKRAGQSTGIALASPFREHSTDEHTETVLPLKGFCYRWARWEEFSQAVIEIGIEARKGARARCRCCRKPAPVYDTRHQARRWRFYFGVGDCRVPGLPVAARGVSAPAGAHVEHLPWASDKLQLCDALRLFLAQWAGLLSWQDVASCFSVSWADVYASKVPRFGGQGRRRYRRKNCKHAFNPSHL